MDVLGTIQSALDLGSAREAQMQAHLSSCDEWHVVDGQVFLRPALFDAWLRTLDSALASFGALPRDSWPLHACCAHCGVTL